MILKRRFLTMVELLITLMILALFVGLIGIKADKALREQRFRSEVAMVVDELRFAQNLMLILNADVHLMFSPQEQGSITMWLELGDSVSPQKVAEFRHPPKRLRAIRYVGKKELSSTENNSKEEQGKLDFRFLSRGEVMTKGFIVLSTSQSLNEKGVLKRYVPLPGYPSPISSVPEQPDTNAYGKGREFDERLTNTTYQEILEHGLNGAQTLQNEVPNEDKKNS